jgi:hypothetical protein
MRHLIATLALSFAFIQGVAAQQSGPVFQADKMELDFGEIPYKGEGTREFKFRNTGNSMLLVTNARGSCGCTVPEWPKEPIRPNETASIRIKYDTSRSGPILKTVTVTTNEVESTDAAGNPVYKQHTITVKGNVRPAPQNDGLPTRTNSSIPQD